MTIEYKIKSLACLKTEKMYISLEKGYERRLFETNDIWGQYAYVVGEYEELAEEIKRHLTGNLDHVAMRNEIADCINTLEILYEIVLRDETI